MNTIVTIKLPDIGEGVAEGEIIEWRKQPNESLNQDEPVVVVMTDKATVELPSPYPGKLIKQYYKPGEIASVGKPLYDLEVSSSVRPPQEKQEFTKEKIEKKESIQSDEMLFTTSHETNKILATPSTRKLAKDLGVQIDSIEGTGKEGRVTDADVVLFHSKSNKRGISLVPSGKRAGPEIYASTPLLHMSDDEEKPLIGIRNLTAEKMVESKYIIPHYSFFDQLDCTRLIQLKDRIRIEAEKEGIKLTFMPFFIKALSLSLKKYPSVNGSVDIVDHKLVIHKHHNVGIATNTPLGLVVCVLKNVQDMSLQQVIRSYDFLMKKAREGKLERADMQDSTITISNFGTLGGLWATPIINYPEIAILGIAKIRKEPVVKNDTVVIRDQVNLSWSFDHRVIDGNGAAEFSNIFIEILKNPAQVL
jgi:pyruvate dehydrogenase E2 component (dihydrolipoamide acetyltransferase)/2-oxoisovalerate dehydrogenase E2 component (dihydrolipoyl transacylase)